MKVIKVDQSKCIGCGQCVALYDEGFEFNDEGLSKAKIDVVDEPSEELISAVESCPSGAIILEDIQESAPEEEQEEEKAA